MQKTKGLIAGGHHATAQAAAVILEAGGNAFDAAIAALMASFVAEPCMSSLGGGAFLTAYRPDGRACSYDCFVQTPRHKRPPEEIEFFPIGIDFGSTVETFHIGMGSVGVPTLVHGMWQIHADMGSIPMHVIAEPAINLAKNGVEVDAFQYHDFKLLENILEVSKPSPVFWRDDRLIKTGETMYMSDFADCLDYLAKEGPRAFYEGEIAKAMLALNEAKGGHLSAEDFLNCQSYRREPLSFQYKDRTILTNPLPSLGGSLIALSLGAMAGVDLNRESSHATLARIFSQLDRLNKTPANLNRALLAMYPHLSSQAGSTSRKLGGTSHFSILDEHGNAVAVTTSNGEGCGHFVPDTGIILNNMLGESALLPNGLHSWEPNVRLGSMMAPTIMLNADHKAEAVLGSGGAGRIPFMLTQVIHQMVDQDRNIEEAVNAPRLHVIDDTCNMEPGLPPNLPLPAGVTAHSWDKQSLYFGGVHAVVHQKGNMQAIGDDRRGGVSLSVGL